MPNFQCPSCSKTGFKDQVTVARHVSQPRSGCNTWLQDLIHLWSVSAHIDHDDLMNADLNEPNIPSIEPEDFTFGDLDDSEAFQGSAESDGQVYKEGKLLTRTSDFVDWYPKASQSYGKGYTFLNLFNSDENSMYYCGKHNKKRTL
ncbi:hypothetical protein F4604DRAFT_1934746 [Suillus subluteus]|nr:hypothetical protein F4604DRAFT_1934746 [Suillus subluteus]